jgi:CBS domain-containing protein
MKVREAVRLSIATTSYDRSLFEASRLMHQRGIGSLAVFDGSLLVGIITERDMVRAIAHGVDLAKTPVTKYMSDAPATVALTDDAADAARLMVRLGVRHLPVSDGRSVVGMLSARDLLMTLDEIKARGRVAQGSRGAM